MQISSDDPFKELGEAWLGTLVFALPMVCLGIFISLVLSRGDTWDKTVDLWLYLALATALILSWISTVKCWISTKLLPIVIIIAGTIYVLLKLFLLIVLVKNPEIIIQEVLESMIWLSPLLLWGVMSDLSQLMRLYLRGIIWGLGLISFLAWVLPLLSSEMVDRNLLRSLIQVDLASAVTLYGATYLLKRNDALGRLKAERNILSKWAYMDLLTGLPGRRSLQEELKHLTEQQQLQLNFKLALLFVDVDSFKVVNDTLGHAIGDELLHCIANELSRLVGEQGQVYRLSGDEFVVVLPQVSAEVAEEVAQRLQREATHKAGLELGIDATLSIGVSVSPEDGKTAEELLRHADSAMYAVKRTGRMHVRRYHPTHDSSTERYQILARELGQALFREELYLVFQPIYRLSDLKMVKIETLVRWNHSTLGAISPAEFIPVAERIGLIKPIGQWVLLQACLAAKQWPDLLLSVNVSAVQLVWADFLPSIKVALAQSELDSQQLELEITETAVLYEDERALLNIRQLRSLGIKFSLDDFGAGYSNLSRLRTMPLDGIKIDRSMISELLDHRVGEFSRALITASIYIARNMNITLTAEGIETPEQLALLKSFGCHLGQGYGLAHPMPAAQLSELYLKQTLVLNTQQHSSQQSNHIQQSNHMLDQQL